MGSFNDKRDSAILQFYARGWTYQRIAERYGLSTARINQIIAGSKQQLTRGIKRRGRKAA
jgi:DNA-directed RNA polymerase specialized sigma24 family protein